MALDKDRLDEFYREYYDLVQDLQSLIIKYGLSEDCFSLSAVGWFKELEDDDEEQSLDLAYHINIASEDDLDEVLSFLSDGYRQQEQNDPSKVDYWIRKAGGDTSIN